MKEIAIAKRFIGGNNPCFVVAEMSGNHNQDFETAVALVYGAKNAGADAVKLQTYTPATITLNSKKKWFMERGVDNPDSWKGKSLYELYESAYTPWDWHPKLQKIAEGLGLIFFSSPFDDTAVDFLESLNVPCYKIAAYEATDIPLLKKVASTKKPVIMSVGFSTKDEVALAVKTLRDNGTKDIVLLHCLTSYSDSPEITDAHLSTMNDLRESFGTLIGFSDNNTGIEVARVASAMGASVIEKHIMLDNQPAGPDTKFSLGESEFKKMVEAIREVEKIKGGIVYGPRNKSEKENLRFRRSLFVTKNIKKGEKFTKENIRSVRPSDGLETKYYEEILGKMANQDIEEATPLSWELIEKDSS